MSYFAMLSWSATAAAQDSRERAVRIFERGEQLMTGRPPLPDQAVALWERSYRVHPMWETLVALARAYERMNRPAEALARIERVLEAHRSELRRTDRRRAEALARRLRRRVASIVVRVEPASASVRIGPRVIEAGEVVRLSPGRHVVVARLDGYRDSSQPVELEAGDEEELHLTLEADVELATVDIRTEPQSAEIFVDGSRRGIAPLSLRLPVGGHRVRAELPERNPEEREITLESGDWETLELSLGSALEIYEEWWFWTLIVLGVGAAVATPVSLWATRQVAPEGEGTIGVVIWSD